MDDSYTFVGGITDFASHFGLALFMLVVFKFLYVRVTPHNEWKLIKDDKNTAAALGLGGAVVGFSIALGGAAGNSVSLVDFAIWGGVALVAQLLAFGLLRFGFMPRLVKRIEENEVSAGLLLLLINISVGVLNAACMTY